MSHGTLATLNEDGTPLATYSSYILEDGGQPLLRLRSDAVHKGNLDRNAKCSLFVQPQDYPARNLARVTLIGKVASQAQQTRNNNSCIASQRQLFSAAGFQWLYLIVHAFISMKDPCPNILACMTLTGKSYA